MQAVGRKPRPHSLRESVAGGPDSAQRNRPEPLMRLSTASPINRSRALGRNSLRVSVRAAWRRAPGKSETFGEARVFSSHTSPPELEK
jgi:hypothetical protein